jgi:hypothetical protein
MRSNQPIQGGPDRTNAWDPIFFSRQDLKNFYSAETRPWIDANHQSNVTQDQGELSGAQSATNVNEAQDAVTRGLLDTQDCISIFFSHKLDSKQSLIKADLVEKVCSGADRRYLQQETVPFSDAQGNIAWTDDRCHDTGQGQRRQDGGVATLYQLNRRLLKNVRQFPTRGRADTSRD